ncbi:MAG: bifunctional methylenetetrahydrofolate dehydrogenase/methenyltetrahydrofolate cyclohydrolase FolD [Elusimicrobia bacterium]|jgi:methylenetetrahydrofolate dehydrogenase (NADP+)/methenyltetrahydrofolate cyclohydrolase|nr:bifunctional methylenetetrahydrofolate dehydrogenase/methenyltetrahydrofolate cyclohydrolase FolD [Elusimicrobiota bacterium]MBK7207148.1 bifunctional methylenetetrahydrofolate dehydrogenase/methenyltetrahydrofolate cyclohydrolase FolD [Elusimicrobiota bacterium]MBK7545954.1 bifunctional methylenetetrahydrofolate dehydrogenase/methenyltetrahydrofolate cyclohydrolase FolD [Elusimicrobiota bacterium]MBK7574830.1 bifunctional methylenetetrahydrofolate dehydrogenase/methenyltetrahydrofolate cyclo
MSARVLDGKAAAARVLDRVAEKAAAVKKRTGVVPGLATVLVGDDPASHVYVGQKIKKCEAAGMTSIHVPLPANVSQDGLRAEVERLNRDPRVHGVIVQLPLPKPLDAEPILLALDPAKDADGLHPSNQGRWMALRSWSEVRATGLPLPCTPAGVMEILEQNQVPIARRRAVVVGRSNLVGKPLAALLLAADATVTVAHSRTENIGDLCREADILVAAIGQPRFVRGDWVKPGAVVVDVGINRTPEGLVGDVDYAPAAARASAITPVPGGVGPMTVAMLLWNTAQAAEKQLS